MVVWQIDLGTTVFCLLGWAIAIFVHYRLTKQQESHFDAIRALAEQMATDSESRNVYQKRGMTTMDMLEGMRKGIDAIHKAVGAKPIDPSSN